MSLRNNIQEYTIELIEALYLDTSNLMYKSKKKEKYGAAAPPYHTRFRLAISTRNIENCIYDLWWWISFSVPPGIEVIHYDKVSRVFCTTDACSNFIRFFRANPNFKITTGRLDSVYVTLQPAYVDYATLLNLTFDHNHNKVKTYVLLNNPRHAPLIMAYYSKEVVGGRWSEIEELVHTNKLAAYVYKSIPKKVLNK